MLFGSAMSVIVSGMQLVIGNIDVVGIDGINLYGDVSSGMLVFVGSNVIISTSVVVGSSGNSITFTSAFQFALVLFASRFYLVNGVVSYVCSAGAVTCYIGYPLQKTQSVNGAGAPLGTALSALLLDGVSSC